MSFGWKMTGALRRKTSGNVEVLEFELWERPLPRQTRNSFHGVLQEQLPSDQENCRIALLISSLGCRIAGLIRSVVGLILSLFVDPEANRDGKAAGVERKVP